MARLCALLLPACLLALAACRQELPPEAQVEQAIHHYFSTWSEPDMTAYSNCFTDTASILFKGPHGQIHRLDLPRFIQSQVQAHAAAESPMTESPTSIVITMEGDFANADVRWKMTAGDTVLTGLDVFRFQRESSKGWKIDRLYVENDPQE